MKKRVFALFLSLSLAVALAAPAMAAQDIPSAWANDAVVWLKGTNKLSDADFAGYDRTVTRADFARLGVILYELITGMPKPDPSDVKNPFTDTADLDILRAYKIKIVSGTGDGTTFSPNDSVNREQIAVMLLRVLDTCGVTYSQADVNSITFSDEAELSGWAAESVKRAYLIQIMNGTGGSSMSPKMTVTMEQAYQLLYNVYTNRDAIRSGAVRSISSGAAGTLSVKYTGGGKYATGWCEDAYHSRPVVCDVDKDGSLEILAASHSIICLDAASGSLKWRLPAGKDRNTSTDGTDLLLRTWPDLYVGDIDGDGKNEIVVGSGSSILHQGVLAVYDENGYFKPGWPQTLPDEVYSVAVADLDGDGTLEIAAGIGIGDGLSVYVYEHDGSVRPGWPQLDAAHDGNKTLVLPESDPKAPSLGYSYGIFNDNLAIGDIDGDGVKEIVAPADMGQICAYKPDGTQVRTNMSMDYGKNFGVTEKVVWGRVGAFSDADYESKVYNGGFGRQSDLMGNQLTLSSLPMSERLTAHFTHSKAVIADLDGNGKNEVVVVGDIHDRAAEAAANAGADLPHLYHELFIFNGDRTRFNSAWATEPTVKDAPIFPLTNDDWETMNRCMPDPVCADLDGDGKMEILYPDFSGKLNCYSLDHTQHGSFPINVYDGSTIEYATAPAVQDVNGDGKSEIIFATYTQIKGGAKRGSLYIADNMGKVLQKIELPAATDTSSQVPNGCLSIPVVADVDGDGRMEIVLNTYLSGVTVYDLD